MLRESFDHGLSFLVVPVVSHHDASAINARKKDYAFSNSCVASCNDLICDKSGMDDHCNQEEPKEGGRIEEVNKHPTIEGLNSLTTLKP